MSNQYTFRVINETTKEEHETTVEASSFEEALRKAIAINPDEYVYTCKSDQPLASSQKPTVRP